MRGIPVYATFSYMLWDGDLTSLHHAQQLLDAELMYDSYEHGICFATGAGPGSGGRCIQRRGTLVGGHGSHCGHVSQRRSARGIHDWAGGILLVRHQRRAKPSFPFIRVTLKVCLRRSITESARC